MPREEDTIRRVTLWRGDVVIDINELRLLKDAAEKLRTWEQHRDAARHPDVPRGTEIRRHVLLETRDGLRQAIDVELRHPLTPESVIVRDLWSTEPPRFVSDHERSRLHVDPIIHKRTYKFRGRYADHTNWDHLGNPEFHSLPIFEER